MFLYKLQLHQVWPKSPSSSCNISEIIYWSYPWIFHDVMKFYRAFCYIYATIADRGKLGNIETRISLELK